MNLAELAAVERVKALVFSPSKSGKTFGAGTFPRPNFMDFDNGMRTLVGRDFLTKHGFKPDVMFHTFLEENRTSAGVVKLANAFDEATQYFEECMKPKGKWKGKDVGRDMFDTWVVDTGTTLADAAMNKGMILLGGAGFAGAKSNTHAEGIKHGLVVPKKQDYGAERSMVEQFVQRVHDADKHVLFLCHRKEITTDEGVIKEIVPLLTGKGVETVCLMFDELWYLDTFKSGPGLERKLITQSDGIKKVGSRLGIPDGTPFEWDAIKKALDATKTEIARLTALSPNNPAPRS